jgi:CheY-like chemotaxis protein/two-component sensor histidine kinase
MELSTDRYEIASLINDTSQLNLMRIGSKQLDFKMKVSEKICSHLYGDELRIKQILNNVITNAIKYTEQGNVTLEVNKEYLSKDNINLVFEISDTGQGMTKEQLARIFEKFARFNHEENRHEEGSGLGMSIVKSLLVIMSGKIDIQSKPGVGTTITIKIPQKIADKTPLGKETAENLCNFQFMGKSRTKQTEWEAMPYGKVLVVDDVDTNVFVAKGFLAPYMLRIDTAESGQAAIEKIENGNVYDLILMDQMMPTMDGSEALRRIRELGYNEPIVAYTANALVGQEAELLKGGFDGFVSKPINGPNLDIVLKKFIQAKQPPEVLEAARAIERHTAASIHGVNYSMLCRDFAKGQRNFVADMKKAIEENDFNTAKRLAHTMKGLAGLIGETALIRIASKVENALDKDEHPQDLLNGLYAEVTSVLTALTDKMVIPPPPPPISDKAEIEIILLPLRVQLAENNAEIIHSIPKLAAMNGTEKLVNAIESFDFATALEAVDELLR